MVRIKLKYCTMKPPEVLTERLGKKDPIKLKFKSNANPKYCKPISLPYSLKENVVQEGRLY